jgi:tetrahydromethanopterin S-methyltransferase subunit H
VPGAPHERREVTMLKFAREQKTCRIGGVEVGGQPGERPMVLIGSVFFAGHGIVHDPLQGTFDEAGAKRLLDREAEISAATGCPRFIDVIGETAAALIRYAEFVAANTTSPILVDSPFQKVRMEALRHFAGTDLMPRLVYNSIAEDCTDEELACLQECGVKSAIVLAFSTKAVKPSAKLRLLQDRLLPVARQAGVENLLIDTGVTDVPSVSWTSLAIHQIKEELGYPAGCAPANAIYTWQKMRARGTPAFQASAAAVFAMPRLLGADFLLYGSPQNAQWAYPAVATIDGLLAYGARFTGISVKAGDHPISKVF